jgi:arylsulfatase
MSISRRVLLQSVAGVAVLAGAACANEAGQSYAPKGNGTASASKNTGWKPRNFTEKKPNIVIAILDDIGFGDLGCFGSEIETPCIDRLAAKGVRYNNFHVTALCAPTRACLMTGQNAHKVGVGNIAEWGRPLPGYRGYIRKDVKMLPQMLKDENYNAIAVGKWHMSMVNDQDAMGPFDHWPTGRGFDHWYGFHGSAVDHFHPEVFRNQSQVHPDKSEDYHLSEDLAEQSIRYVKDHKIATPDKPFFLYLGFGACHFPFHAPKPYIDRYMGKFDAGYDALRGPRFERQKALGVVPQNTQLTPRPDDIPPWDSLPKNEQQFSARTEEAFAGMLTHADDQIRRLVDALDEMGELDDTILIVMSDNGAGGGYHRAGALDVRRIAYIGPETVAEKMRGLSDIGSERRNCIYSTGWSFLGNTPLKRRKGDTYEGGTKTPMVIHWPNGNLKSGAINSQYHHIVDMAPTLLEMINATPDLPEPLDGQSFAYSLDNPDATTIKDVQHFETAGDRALWADGWKAVTLHQKGDAFKDDVWALYHTAQDFSEINDLSAQEPERLRRMIALWEREAAANNVLPLDDDLDGLYAKVAPKPRPSYIFYPRQTRLNRLTAPDIYRYDFTLEAHVVMGDSTVNGVILASGDSAAGYELFVKDGYLEFVYIYTRENIYRMRSPSPVPSGAQVLGLNGNVTGAGVGTLSMTIDGSAVIQMDLPKMWKVEALNAGIRCGENRGAPISFAYKPPFTFDQTLNRVSVKLAL